MRKPGPPRDIPPPLELDCLKALWALGEANVKEVREALERSLAYTTVMTVLERLVRRGAVARRKSGRSFRYAPLLSRESARRLALKELLDGFFDGSEEALLEYLRSGGIPAAVPAAAAEESLDTALL